MHAKTTSHSCLRPEKKEAEEQLGKGKGKPGLLRQRWAFVVLTVCHLLTVSRSQEEVARRTEMRLTTPQGAEVNPSLTHSACTPAKSYIKTP